MSVFTSAELWVNMNGVRTARATSKLPLFGHTVAALVRGRRRRGGSFSVRFLIKLGGGRGEAERSFEPIEEKSGQIDSALRNRVAAQSISCWFWTVISRVIVIVKARARAYLCCSNSTPFDLSEMSWERMTVLYVSGMK